MAISGDVLAVVAVAAREIAFYDTETLEQLAVLPGGAGPSHIVAAPDGRFYVTDTGGDAILVYEGEGPEGPRLLDRTNVPGSPYGIAGRFQARSPLGDPNGRKPRSTSSRSPIWPPRSPTATRPSASRTASASTSAAARSSSPGARPVTVQIFDTTEEDEGG